MTQHSFYATAPRGVEKLLSDELRQLGAIDVEQRRAGAIFKGDLEIAYRVALWSRFANRLLMTLAEFPAPNADALYEGTRSIAWHEHLGAEGTLAVDFTGSAQWINDSRFGALKVKDAVVDVMRDKHGVRPDVDTDRPDLRIHLHIHNDLATISLDLSGESLHRRGYREQGSRAPLKENLAGAILSLAGWPAVAEKGGALVDPMCGSGTFLVEAALMAADIAPGLQRDHFGFLGWLHHDDTLWQRLLGEAEERRVAGLEKLSPIQGSDTDVRAVKAAKGNIARAGLRDHISVSAQRFIYSKPPEGASSGLVIANPPYGERIGDKQKLIGLYREIGTHLGEAYNGWKGALLVADDMLQHSISLKPTRSYPLLNGTIECQLHCYGFLKPGKQVQGGEMFANRLRKNLKHLSRWARKNSVSCYRLYDADLPEYAVAVDLYQEAGDGSQWLHVQEYAPPKTIDKQKAEQRLFEVMQVLYEVMELPPERVVLKVRERAKGGSQYGRRDEKKNYIVVEECGAQFRVNLTDYLDTGLFLDHRITREKVRELARDKRFLNLFAYTGSVTVYAAQGGARSTTTIDLSTTYLEWAKQNMALNGFAEGPHAYVRADCSEWLEDAQGEYGLIFIDPPTFSNSKRMEGVFDVQRDHVALIKRAVGLLEPDGVVLFSNNRRDFKLDKEALADLKIEEITRATIPEDFKRNQKIHHAWLMRRS
ncbi:23S rRNA (guanine(2445)-N(2))/(guanine(2069)-N(7))-methyltransferase [Solemya pervernicosa gill symbiont]|uniref:Ribosomal RNA large subunit methyltransferase K/L n=2 Tax=Gammaproteobacteria incertae sedis TaxID=118884 RepID=A0A1T2L3J5_9GAMM|nr:bifunctional 23S rRNA (guanine(2069)-N(7))-methyltransferase RlmK/23S rRNA (guanine(2445)-N(2))-methyltransferase RlmL [Candidatus Reidiella endopervernicosa]OOZ39673.1 23S rRNA (guanine(2445)-N(2))/(guanine(2069)-N(7))-methyltransferase [Solemya pervernicosa gill symbiont]QKQ27768.1 bifunctional 23S rRNA (guanine(2069)-N(7))-methyltransferase RlmK/23S rRNA (guanine(2445)-N(2))-methyltransferase RlmL [Candidatus Reidiella endopervernicosa]